MSMLLTLSDTSLPLDPLHYLLGLPFLGLKKTTKWVLSYILLGARRVIPVSWLSRDPPTRTRLEICKMVDLTASATVTIPKLNKIGELWDTSKYGVDPATS